MGILKKVRPAVITVSLIFALSAVPVMAGNSTYDSAMTESGWVKSGAVKYTEKQPFKMQQGKMTMKVGDTVMIGYLGNCERNEISWESKNPNIVQVDANGYAHALTYGQTSITAMYNGKKRKISVRVKKNKTVGALLAEEIHIKKGSTVSLPKLYKVGKSNTKYTISDPSILLLKNKKKFRGVKAGETLIHVESNDKAHQADAKVYVTDTTVSDANVSIQVGETKKLVLDGDDGNTIWRSSKSKTVAVDALGVVTGIKEGKAVVRARTNGKTVKFNITVTGQAPEKHDHKGENVVALIRQNKYLTLAFYPCGSYVEIQTLNYDGTNSDSGNSGSEYFTYTTETSSDGAFKVRITGLTKKGKNESHLTIPSVINSMDVFAVDDAALDVEDIDFDSKLPVNALPATLKDHVYTNGNFHYSYTVDKESIFATLVSVNGDFSKKLLDIPSDVHGYPVNVINPEALNAKEINPVSSLSANIVDKYLTEKVNNNGTFLYKYSVSGQKIYSSLTGLSDGVSSNKVTLPVSIRKYPVRNIVDDVLNCYDLVLGKDFDVSILPSTINRHVYSKKNGSFKYSYVKEGNSLSVVLEDLMDSAISNKYVEIPSKYNGYRVSKVKPAVLNIEDLDLEKGISTGIFPETFSENSFTKNSFVYSYVPETENTFSVWLRNVGKSTIAADRIKLTETYNGYKISGIDSNAIKVSDLEISKNVLSSVLPEDLESHIYTKNGLKYSYRKENDGSISIVIRSLTSATISAGSITIPVSIYGYPVSEVKGAVADINDIAFADGFDLDIIPDEVYNHTYVNGSFKYKYVNNQGTMAISLVDMSDSSVEEDFVHIKSKINGFNVISVIDDAIDASDIEIDSDVDVSILPAGLSNHDYTYGNFVYGYAVNNGVLSTTLKDLSEAGQQESMITVPSSFKNYTVTEIESEALDAPDVEIAANYDPAVLPDDINTLSYEYGDYEYHYVKVNGVLTTVLDDAKSTDSKTISATFKNHPLSGIEMDAINRDNILIDSDVPASVLPANIASQSFTYENVVYHYSVNGDDIFTNLDDLNGATTIPSSFAGYSVASVDTDGITAEDVVLDSGLVPGVMDNDFFDKEFVNGGFSYKYVDGGSDFTTAMTGLSGYQGGMVTIPVSINSKNVSSVDISVFEAADDMMFEEGFDNSNVDLDDLATVTKVNGNFKYHYVGSGTTFGAVLTGISDAGYEYAAENDNAIEIVSDVNGYNTEVSEDLTDEAQENHITLVY